MSRNVIFRKIAPAAANFQRRHGFTLVELLTVLAIVTIMISLIAFAISSLKGSRDITKSANLLMGALEQARTYALANNTYAWVGFFEEDGSKPSTNPATSGVGRLVISLVASQDGTRYSDNVISSSQPEAFGTDSSLTSSNKTILTQISPLLKLDNVHMVAANSGTSSGNNPARPAALASYQLGEPSGQAPNNATGLFAASSPTDIARPAR
jgi:prepilin-type N-terminal cleavage/methylation domain-containing protein